MRDKESRMAELRLDKGLEQKEIANYLNVLEDTYSKWERGINDMPIEISNKLANYYNVSLDFLLGLSDYNVRTKLKEVNFDVMRKRLITLRKENKLTQEALGLEVGFPQKTYANYENGISIPTSFKLTYIAIYYGVSFDYLVGRSNDEKIKIE